MTRGDSGNSRFLFFRIVIVIHWFKNIYHSDCLNRVPFPGI